MTKMFLNQEYTHDYITWNSRKNCNFTHVEEIGNLLKCVVHFFICDVDSALFVTNYLKTCQWRDKFCEKFDTKISFFVNNDDKWMIKLIYNTSSCLLFRITCKNNFWYSFVNITRTSTIHYSFTYFVVFIIRTIH